MEYAKRIIPKRFTTVSSSAEAADATKSPVLSPEDEAFLTSRLQDAPEIILPGTASSTPSSAATPSNEIPELALATPIPPTPANERAELIDGGEAMDDDENPAEEKKSWRASLSAGMAGLRRRVSHREGSPGQGQKRKGQDPPEEEESEKKKGKRRASPSPPPLPPRPDRASATTEPDADTREAELTTVLDSLSLQATSRGAFTLSPRTHTLISRFTQILKDLLNGVPTAFGDLTDFLESSSSQLQEAFNDLPGFVQKLVKTLPGKLSPALTTAGLKELVGQPEALAGALRGVVKAVQTRWPALMGGSAALSLGLFVVMLGLWYCYKRGKEERLKKEAEEEGEMEMQVVVEGGRAAGNVLEGGVREDPLVVRGRKVG